MAATSLIRQFHGTCALMRVQLMRAAQCSDVEACFPLVRERGLIDREDERLIRACFAADEELFGAADARAGRLAPAECETPAVVSQETIAALHMIVSSRLNVADSA